ncbi:unnamed protein product [Paramecium pentaurelia]|uniref:Transmembrane protein n=1 Tax=Paramecium pentaurelia TaxID=43138 RepID=A0A8S1YFK0_9CILI|nr:unnamed protein product [Paramecium pentaurelia]
MAEILVDEGLLRIFKIIIQFYGKVPLKYPASRSQRKAVILVQELSIKLVSFAILDTYYFLKTFRKGLKIISSNTKFPRFLQQSLTPKLQFLSFFCITNQKLKQFLFLIFLMMIDCFQQLFHLFIYY